MSTLEIDAQVREVTGRKVGQLRRAGLVPVVIYGRGREPQNAQVDAATFDKVLRGGGNSQLVKINLEGKGTRNVLIREVQRDPVRHYLLHADLYTVDMTQKQHVTVPIISTGRALGQNVDMVLVQSMDHVEIEALPADIPASIEVDVSSLETPDSPPITVADLPDLPGIAYLTPASEHLFSLVLTRGAMEEEEEEESSILGTEMAEPEVIGRGKGDGEEDDE
jgi:large subunit ribosomal protein L25